MKILIILLILLHLFSCNESSLQTQVQKDTSFVSRNLVDTQSNYFQRIASLIGLVEPNAKDSFILRLWITSMVIPHQMIELRKGEDGWISKKYDYYDETDDKVMFKNIPLKGQSSLNTLVDSLRQIDFAALISQEDIRGFVDNVADGVTYHMEIIKPSLYKRLTYHCPETFYSSEINNKRFVDILMVLDKYFLFFSPKCKKG